MGRIYGYINSLNLLSTLSLVLLWAARLFGWEILSEAIVNNYIALTAVYAPPALLSVQILILVVQQLMKKEAEYYQKTTILFSLVNLLVYLLYLAYVKYA